MECVTIYVGHTQITSQCSWVWIGHCMCLSLQSGITPLMSACTRNCVDTVQYLLDQKPSLLNAQSEVCELKWYCAIAIGYIHMLACLEWMVSSDVCL